MLAKIRSSAAIAVRARKRALDELPLVRRQIRRCEQRICGSGHFAVFFSAGQNHDERRRLLRGVGSTLPHAFPKTSKVPRSRTACECMNKARRASIQPPH
jgi:hypothetical protein